MKEPHKIRLGIALAAFLLGAAVLLALGRPVAETNVFDDDFTDRTMRVDYFHSGTATEEHISLDRIVSDGPWPGSRTRLADDTNLGKYLFEVTDRATNRVLYSRGFSSVYGEWETTGEAKKLWRTFHESLRFPWPKRPVQVTLKKRDRENVFREIWATAIDPNSRFALRADIAPRGRVWTVFENGPTPARVDLLILGDGYTAAEMEKFHSDVARLVGALFEKEPFRSRKSDFNVRALDLASAESGIARPHASVFRRSPLSTHYSSFDSERYVLTYDNRTLRDVAYQTGAPEKPEPWEPNLTVLHDPAKLKWNALVEPGTPIPTPWDKAAFEKESRAVQERRRKLRASGAPEEEMEKLFREEEAAETPLLAGMKYSGKVGAFEGAGYEAKGLYRPRTDCIMFSRDKVGFCPVCRRAIERVINLYTRP